MIGRRALAFVLVAFCAAVILGMVSFSPARGGTDANPCPDPGRHLTGTESGVAGRPGVWLICEGPATIPKLDTFYVPYAPQLLMACPVGTYVIGGRAGVATADWNYSAGRSLSPVPSGRTSVVTWGGIVSRWEKDGRWTGGVAPLLTNWGEPSDDRPLWVQTWFYCAPPGQAAAPQGAASMAGCQPGVLGKGGSPPPAHAEPPKVNRGSTAPPPPTPVKVETAPPGDSTLHGGDGTEILEARCTGNETLIGGHGTQTLIAGGGRDTLKAGTGTQTLIGGTGRDTLVGGTGKDTFYAWGPGTRVLAGTGPSRIAAYAKHVIVDCRNHPAVVLAIRGTTIRRCSNVHYVKAPKTPTG